MIDRSPTAKLVISQRAFDTYVARRAEQAILSKIGDATIAAIAEDLEATGVQLDDPWEFYELTFFMSGRRRRVHIRVVTPGPAPSICALSLVRFEAPYEWADEHQPYRVEIFGLETRSRELFDQSKAADVQWVMQFDEAGQSAHAVAAYRTRAVKPGAPTFAQTEWRPGWPVVKKTYGGNMPADTRPAAIGLELLANVQHGQQGRKRGDGATWPGGKEDFLDDLWTTVDRSTAATGSKFPRLTGATGKPFRMMMRGHPSERTLRDWLKDADLRPRDVESGKVTRENYSQFVAERSL